MRSLERKMDADQLNSSELSGPFSEPRVSEMDSPNHCEHLQLFRCRSQALLYNFDQFGTNFEFLIQLKSKRNPIIREKIIAAIKKNGRDE
jgi:hypothetical protein